MKRSKFTTTVLLNPNHLTRFDLDQLGRLGCYLEGIKTGSGGSLHPLGTATIDSLWKAIRTLNEIVDDPKLNPKGVLDK